MDSNRNKTEGEKPYSASANQNRVHIQLEEIQSNEMEIGFSNHIVQFQPRVKKTRKGCLKYIGMLCAVLAAICGSFASLGSKILTQRKYSPVSITLWRYQGMTTIVPLFVIYLRVVKKKNVLEGLDKKSVFFLTVRGIIGVWSFGLFVYSLQYLNVADTVVITFSTPITVTLFAWICLGESCGIVPIIVALVTLSGVVVLSRPPILTGAMEFDNQTLIGISMSLGSMFTLTGIFVVLRYLRKVHVTVPILFSGFVASVHLIIVGLIFEILEFPQTLEDGLIACGVAGSSVAAHVFMNVSLKFEEAGPVALIRTSDIVFAFILQLVFLGVAPDIFSVVGALIIMCGILLTTFRKWITTLPEENPSRIKYWYMLK